MLTSTTSIWLSQRLTDENNAEDLTILIPFILTTPTGQERIVLYPLLSADVRARTILSLSLIQEPVRLQVE